MSTGLDGFFDSLPTYLAINYRMKNRNRRLKAEGSVFAEEKAFLTQRGPTQARTF